MGCSEKEESDIIFNDLVPPRKLELQGNLITLSQNVDVNADGHVDYSFEVLKFLKDDIYYKQDVFYITIKRVNSYLQSNNPYEPVVLIDQFSDDLTNVTSIFTWKMAKFYQAKEKVENNSIAFISAFLSKDDEFETVKTKGDYFIPVMMQKGNNTHYGWIHINMEDYSLSVLGYGFCKTPYRQIGMGEK
jgi:hypothetical protein